MPIVALTGDAAGDWIQRAAAAGAVDHVTKPFSEAGLVDTLRGALASWTRGAERRAEHDRIRVRIETMLREHRPEREIVAVVRTMTGEPAPPRGLATALRRLAARARRLRHTRRPA